MVRKISRVKTLTVKNFRGSVYFLLSDARGFFLLFI